MRATEPLALHHSWPLFGSGYRFNLGRTLDGHDMVALDPMPDDAGLLEARGIGRWSCDLADDRLTWSPAVYDLFGFARGVRVSRAETVARYAEPSRAAMERLRLYAIRHRRGFTLDAELLVPGAGARWMRLVAAPLCEGGRVVALRGLKWDVSGEA